MLLGAGSCHSGDCDTASAYGCQWAPQGSLPPAPLLGHLLSGEKLALVQLALPPGYLVTTVHSHGVVDPGLPLPTDPDVAGLFVPGHSCEAGKEGCWSHGGPPTLIHSLKLGLRLNHA